MRAGIALGSNLGDRLAYLRAALAAVRALPGAAEPPLVSRVYETEPVGTSAEAGAFLNAVVEIGCSSNAVTLLAQLREIEARLGRPTLRTLNASRTVDLDLLYLGDLELQSPGLTLPHPRLHLRRFVLQPLYDVNPTLRLPGQTATVAELLHALTDPAQVELFPEPLCP